MISQETITILSFIDLVGSFILIVILLVLAIRMNHVAKTLSRMSDTIGDSFVKLIPAVLNIATVGKGIHEVLQGLAEHKKRHEK